MSGRTDLPDFIIIGAPKAGTTSLHRYLATHPQIYMTPDKEPRYMAHPDVRPTYRGGTARKYNREVTWRFDEYRRLFAGRRDELVAGEASPLYMWSPVAAETIHRLVPEAKLVAILRDPVSRAYSHFFHNRRLGREPLADFGAALAAERERVEYGWIPTVHYRGRGRYGEQLTRYLELFPRDRLIVFLQEDLSRRPAEMMAELCRFLGVDDNFEFDTTKRHNVTDGVPKRIWLSRLFAEQSRLKDAARKVVPVAVRNALFERFYHSNFEKRPPLDPAIRRMLRDEFRDDILVLQDLIGRDLSAWLND